MLHRARAWGRRYKLVGAVVGLEGRREELGPKKMGMRLNRKLHDLLMEVINWCCSEAASDNTECRILHQLEPGERRR